MEEAKSPSVKSAVNFFNSLSRSSAKSNLEVSLKINTERHQEIHVSSIEVQKFIPRPKLVKKSSTENEQLPPDVEAKKIIEDFNKKISPYNTFKLPVNAIHSDFFKQNLQQFLPDVVFPKKEKPRRNRVYRKPSKRY
ncbi:hypothetical protein BDFB_009909 [Asbolus verrucosus]|uniref:Uncharacterized protein n=1 Tax=Asbolus verrucosus TaxID=1661398 RepID=A0A482VPQ9_ASBVE|nr:hypothetical protein BDFB_009909 [Asbolus verrucosus]